MNELKFIFAISLFGVLFQSCSNSDEIDISMNPENGDKISAENTKSFPLEIILSSENEMHEIIVQLYEKNSPEALLINDTTKDKLLEFSFKENIDISSYKSGTEFVFLASISTDSDGSVTRIPTTTFSIE